MPRLTPLVFAVPALLITAVSTTATMVAAPSTPTTSTVPTTSTTTTTVAPNHRAIMEVGQPPVPTTVPLGFDPICGEPLMRLALHVGWPFEELPTLDRVARRESGGDCGNTDYNYSHNAADPQNGTGFGSMGTMQTNSYWCAQNQYNPHPAGWLGEHGVITRCEDLFNVTVNLRAALLIWQRSGWSPWGM